MNRRSFFKTLATAAAAFTILPSAVTYDRAKWVRRKASGIFIVNPAWRDAPYELGFIIPVGMDKPVGSVLFHKDKPVRWASIGEVAGHIKSEHFPLRYSEPDMDSPPIPPIIELA